MSLVGIGTDLVAIDRLGRMHRAHGERLAVRLLASSELAGYRQAAAGVRESVRDRDTSPAAAFLARRFAAKEAAAKALGCGIGAGAGFHDLIVGHTPAGAPRLEFSGAARTTAARLGVTTTHLSISDEQGYALAFVVLER